MAWSASTPHVHCDEEKKRLYENGLVPLDKARVVFCLRGV